MTVRDFLENERYRFRQELDDYTARSTIADADTFMRATDEKTGLTNAAAMTLTRKEYFKRIDWLSELPVEVLSAEIKEPLTELQKAIRDGAKAICEKYFGGAESKDDL